MKLLGWIDPEWLGALLMPLGAWALPLHPWGLCLLLAGFLILVHGRQAYGEAWRPGLTGSSLPIGRIRLLAVLGLAAGSAAAGARLAEGVFDPVVLPAQWPHLGLLAAAALLLILGSALAMPLRPPLRVTPQVPAGRSAGIFFWGFCALVAAWSQGRLTLGFVGLAGALLLAPGDGLEQAWPRPAWASWALAGLLIVGLGLHLWQLDLLPHGLNIEEYVTLELANPVVEGQPQSLLSVSDTFSGLTLYHHVIGWIYQGLQGRSIVPLRLTSVLGWAVLAGYGTLLARSFFRWPAALATAAYFSFSFFALHYGRFGFYFIWAPAVAAAALAHAVWALRSSRPALHLVLAALWSAASLYGWISGWVTPALPALYLAMALGRDRARWRALAPSLLLAGLAFVVVVLPAAVLHARLPNGLASLFLHNSGSIFQPRAAVDGVDLSSNLALHLDELLHIGTRDAKHFLPGLPVFSWQVLLLVVAGSAHLLRRPNSATTGALMTAMALGFLPLWISDPGGRNVGRIILLLLPVGLLFGAGALAVANALRSLMNGRPWATGLLGAACLLGALGREPWSYFHDYRLSKAAVVANRGASAYMGRQVRALLQPDEDLYYSQRYHDAPTLIHQLPRRARITPLRGAPDFLRLFAQSPKGMLMASGIHEDWLPWLRLFAPDIEVLKVDNPWGEDLFEGKHHFKHMDHPGLLAPLMRWRQAPQGIGFEPAGSGRWKGQLWVGRTDRYRLSISAGSLLLANKHRVEAGRPREFLLNSVPYELLVTGSPGPPVLTAIIPDDTRQEEWPHPVVHGVPLQGLRRTLSGIAGRESGPVRISLRPVLSQRYSIWSYEADETTLRFPWQGWWEGWLRVPVSGLYEFQCSTNFGGELLLQLGDRNAFHVQPGAAAEAPPIELKAGQDYPMNLHAFRIDYDQSMHLLVRGPDGMQRSVPSEWMRPAPLPGPLPLKGSGS